MSIRRRSISLNLLFWTALSAAQAERFPDLNKQPMLPVQLTYLTADQTFRAIMPAQEIKLQIVQNIPMSSRTQIMTAHQHIADGQIREAEEELRRVVKTEPNQADARYLLGYVLFREQRMLDSLAAYTAGAALRPPSAADLIIVASNYILLKDLSDAKRWLIVATEQSPNNGSAWYLLGRTLYNLDDAGSAVKAFKRRLELAPKDARAEYNLGLAYQRLGEMHEAESAYQTAIAWQVDLGVKDAQPYFDLGILQQSDGRLEQALTSLKQAASLAPDNAMIEQQLGVCLQALGRIDEAVAPIKRATELAPDASQAHFLLGRLYRRLHRESDAVHEFAEVTRLLGTHSGQDTPDELRPTELPK